MHNTPTRKQHSICKSTYVVTLYKVRSKNSIPLDLVYTKFLGGPNVEIGYIQFYVVFILFSFGQTNKPLFSFCFDNTMAVALYEK